MVTFLSLHNYFDRIMLNGKPSDVLGWKALTLTKCWELGLALRVMVVVVEQDVLGL